MPVTEDLRQPDKKINVNNSGMDAFQKKCHELSNDVFLLSQTKEGTQRRVFQKASDLAKRTQSALALSDYNS